jgi:hypothetical protein
MTNKKNNKKGYNRLNFLLKVKAVSEVYLQYKEHGVSNEFVFENYIQKQFFISRTTFFSYLTIPYKKELEELQKKLANN